MLLLHAPRLRFRLSEYTYRRRCDGIKRSSSSVFACDFECATHANIRCAHSRVWPLLFLKGRRPRRLMRTSCVVVLRCPGVWCAVTWAHPLTGSRRARDGDWVWVCVCVRERKPPEYAIIRSRFEIARIIIIILVIINVCVFIIFSSVLRTSFFAYRFSM